MGQTADGSKGEERGGAQGVVCGGGQRRARPRACSTSPGSPTWAARCPRGPGRPPPAPDWPHDCPHAQCHAPRRRGAEPGCGLLAHNLISSDCLPAHTEARVGGCRRCWCQWAGASEPASKACRGPCAEGRVTHLGVEVEQALVDLAQQHAGGAGSASRGTDARGGSCPAKLPRALRLTLLWVGLRKARWR